jgi:hypothetical protein
VLAAIVIAGTVASESRADNNLPAPGWAVTATTTTTGLHDGQVVTINVRVNPAVNIFNLQILQCRADATYSSSDDILFSKGNCASGPVSSSADFVVVRKASSGLPVQAKADTGASVPYRVGLGQIDTPIGPLICDASHPCALVVELQLSGAFAYTKIPLTFASSDPIAGCGGAASGVVSTGGSDQMSDVWQAWTLGACQRPGASGAPTSAVFTGEGSAVQSFASGDLDLAYTGAAYDPSVGLVDPSASRRSAVAVPVALNAAVIAVGGGRIAPTGEKVPYQDIKLTLRDLAALFSGGIPLVTDVGKSYQASILASNPELGGVPFALVPSARPMAPSEAESSSWFMTNYLASLDPSDWVTPDSGQARGASPSMATASPAFSALDLFSGRPILEKVIAVSQNAVSSPGPIWVMTDLATAKALGLTPVSIENAAGDFVAPTTDSMLAAVSTMKPDANRILLPDPHATGANMAATGSVSAATTTEPYPLTYVEYALTPAEPLHDATCALRASSQKLLSSWLDYVTGPGQQQLPPGLVPLPSSLAGTAQSALPLVGASPITGTCAGSSQSPTGSTATPPAGSFGSTSFGSGGPTGSIPTSTGIPRVPTFPGLSAPVQTSANGPAAQPNAKSGQAAVAVPAFAGHSLADATGGVIALIGIVLLLTLGAWVTAGNAGPNATSRDALTARKIGSLALLWTGIGIAAIGLVIFQLGPLLQQRDQRSLLSEYRVQISHAANESSGLGGVTVADKPPDRASAVGVLEIGALKLQDVVVEGVDAGQTSVGPGHVPGTAGLGQPGNSVLVARRNGYGGSFRALGSLHNGDRIVVTTTQGQSVYAVRHVRVDDVTASDASSSGTTSSTSSSTPASSSTTVSSTTVAPSSTTTSSKSSSGSSSSTSYTATSAPGGPGAGASKGTVTVSLDTLYGPTSDDRLTLVTSGSKAPWNTSQAVVVDAKLLTKPFAPTPQGARATGETGIGGDQGAWSSIVLAVLALAGVVVASVALYRRLRFRVAYVLTIAPLVALTVVAGDTIGRLLPAWM